MHSWSGCSDSSPKRHSESTIIGVLSHDTPRQRQLRAAIRDTWLADFRVHGIDGRFVMRGNVSGESDLLLLPNIRAVLGQGAGALVSLMSWLTCASDLWPTARHVGKAEDDVFIHAASVARSLASAASLHDLYWGTFEVYHWSTAGHLPVQWREEVSNCTSRGNGSQDGIWGPFPFAKGPLFFLSASLVRRVLNSPTVRSEAAAAIDNAGDTKPIPYEDVFTGFAVAVAASQPVSLINNPDGRGYYDGGIQLKVSPTAVVVHYSKVKSARVLRSAHAWAASNHCPEADESTEPLHTSLVAVVRGSLCGDASFTMYTRSWPRSFNCSSVAEELEPRCLAHTRIDPRLAALQHFTGHCHAPTNTRAAQACDIHLWRRLDEHGNSSLAEACTEHCCAVAQTVLRCGSPLEQLRDVRISPKSVIVKAISRCDESEE